MDDKNASHVHDGKKTTSLLDLPVEMILYICSFLHPSVLLGLSLVCKKFKEVLKKNTFIWKARTNRIWLRNSSSNPFFQPVQSNELFWKLSRMAIKKIGKWELPKEKLLITNAEYEMMDALLLMHAGTTCIASTKDYSLLYCKIPSFEGVRPCDILVSNHIKFAHNNRICDLTAIDNTIYSCSLDQSIKSWMYINTGLFEQKTYELSGSDGLLCVSSCPERGLFATGSYNGIISVFDSRQDKPFMQYLTHTGAVIKLAMNSEYILSVSEDKTVFVLDHRAGRTMKSITISGGGVPTCINVQRDWVCVGDSIAKLHLLDLKYDFEVKSYSTEHITKITGVHMTDEYLITTAFADRNVIFSSLTDPPQPIVKLFSNYKEHCSRMAYLNDTLAVSDLHDIVVWRRK